MEKELFFLFDRFSVSNWPKSRVESAAQIPRQRRLARNVATSSFYFSRTDTSGECANLSEIITERYWASALSQFRNE